MKPKAPIIAGIDFSPSSTQVLHHALHVSSARDTPVIALHVLDDSQLKHHGALELGHPSPGRFLELAKSKLASWVATHAPDADLKLEVRCGRPAEELHNIVKDHEASLLVIAANDNSKRRLGSIASRCVRSVTCDVMVLRDWQSGNFKKIVACTDFSPTAARVLDRAVAIATEQGAELEVVHVIYPPSRDIYGELLEGDDDSNKSYAEQCHEKANASMERFTEPHREALAGITHHGTILESEVPSVALTHHASDSGADLVVMGTRGHSRFMSHFIGTNAERLMHDSAVSVLAVRSPE